MELELQTRYFQIELESRDNECNYYKRMLVKHGIECQEFVDDENYR